MEFGSFPKNLAYNVTNLSVFSKTVVKLTPTPNTVVESGSTFKVHLPPNTLIDLRTFDANPSNRATGYPSPVPR